MHTYVGITDIALVTLLLLIRRVDPVSVIG